MSRTFRAFFTGFVVFAGITGIQAAQSGPVKVSPSAARASAVPSHEPSLDRAVLDRYCVGCHNGRLKTAGLSLEKLDLTQVQGNAEILEKVAFKLRTGQMPPAGRPRPEQSVADSFLVTLETALDRAAAGAPNPGRLPVHRLNRLEYVNVIRDLLALEIDGSTLLPEDNSGLGFDNNADVLSVTPALMSRYMSAATKVSRLAVGDSAIRPVIQVYSASQFGRQHGRMSEDLPFGTHGGLAIRHTFPLDG